MAQKETVFPLDNDAFREDARTFFSLTSNQLRDLVSTFAELGKLFSTAVVSRKLHVESRKSKSIRYTLLAFTDTLTRKHSDPKEFANELKSVGCDEEKVELFVDELAKMSSETLARNSLFLLDVIRYGTRLHHLSTLGVSYNYTLLETPKDGLEARPLFPLVRLEIESHRPGGESHSVAFDLDSNEFESLILDLQESLADLRVECKALKRSLGDKFTELVVE